MFIRIELLVTFHPIISFLKGFGLPLIHVPSKLNIGVIRQAKCMERLTCNFVRQIGIAMDFLNVIILFEFFN
ncbi:MAG: hypothetical protein ACI9BD_000682 [Candidatus Marinamargulisbacteria bacterium]|jgi:hypothetical protein